jgi:hypothetical protein
MPILQSPAKIPFYPDDLLPRMQRILAILADLDLQHEAQRNDLDQWAGPNEVKERLLAELDQCHRANRERLLSCLEGCLKGRDLVPATLRRTDFGQEGEM